MHPVIACATNTISTSSSRGLWSRYWRRAIHLRRMSSSPVLPSRQAIDLRWEIILVYLRPAGAVTQSAISFTGRGRRPMHRFGVAAAFGGSPTVFGQLVLAVSSNVATELARAPKRDHSSGGGLEMGWVASAR